MKKAIKALWHGIKSVFTAIVDWATTLFGMKDETKYSRVLRRIVGTAFAVAVLLWAVTSIVVFFRNIDLEVCNPFDNDDDYYVSETVTDDLFFYDGYYDKVGYIANADGKKLVKNVCWIAKPMEGDSLVCYSDGERRGFFHMRDGHVVIKPTYDHAWIFSGGLAAVERDGRVMFIDADGNVVIDRHFTYDGSSDYVFHNGCCAVHDSTGKSVGLIDSKGDWVVSPQYESIIPYDTFWIVKSGDRQAVLNIDLDTVMPMTKAVFEICNTTILATFDNHTMSAYSLQGKLLAASQIRDVEQMLYELREVMYPVNEDGKECSDEYYSYGNPIQRMAVATCYKYEAEWGWYGLMDAAGHKLTPPLYARIEAVDKDLYLCETSYGRGELLDSRGRKVE